MTGRVVELQQVEDILKSSSEIADKVEQRVYRSRVSPTQAMGGLHDIRIYTPTFRAKHARGRTAKYDTSLTIHIEVRVVGVEEWDAVAGQITDAVLDVLLTNSSWLSRFSEIPDFDISQFKDGEGEHIVCGEIITLQLSPKHYLEYTPSHTDVLSSANVVVVDDNDDTLAEMNINE
jgi:hypothetical protein